MEQVHGGRDHEDDQRAETLLILIQDERVGVVHSGEEKATGRPCSRFPVPKEATRQIQRDLLQGHVVTEQGEMVLK